jgi:hypothetical protein
MALDLHLEAALDDRITREFTKRALWKLQYVRRDAIFLQQRLLQVGSSISSSLFRILEREKQVIRTFVKWNCSGSSVLRLTLSPALKKSGNGFRSYVRKSALLLSGLMAMPICLR